MMGRHVGYLEKGERQEKKGGIDDSEGMRIS